MLNIKIQRDKITVQEVLFVVFALVLTALLYMRDINGKYTNKFILLGIVVSYALIADYKHLMMLTAFVLPLTSGLPGNYLLPILCILIVAKGGKRTEVPEGVWGLFIAISIFEFSHIAILSSTLDMPQYVGYCSFLFLILFIGGSYDSRSDEAMNALSFCLGTVVMLVIIMMNFHQLVGDSLLEGDVRIGNTNHYLDSDTMTLRTNPNNIGLYSIAAISISSALWYYKKLPVWALALVAIPAFIGGVYSLSRTWMLSVILFGVLFYTMRRRGKRFSSILVILIAVLGVVFFFTRVNVSVMDAIETRFEGDITAGSRTTLFAAYHEWMFDNPWALLFGTGALPYKEVTQIFNSTHNALQQIFVSYGIPGLFLFFYLLYRFIKKWSIPKERMVFLPLLVIGFFLQSLQFLNPYYCAFPFIGSLFIVKMAKTCGVDGKDRKQIS